MAYTSKNPKFDSMILKSESGTPANPASGSAKLINRSNLLYVRDSSGTETLVSESLDSSTTYQNGSITSSVGGSALTIALKTKSGSDASGASPVYFSFRSATSTTGTYTKVSATSALSLIISSGSTLGHFSGVDEYIYVYVINNAGTVELACSSTLYDEGSIVSTTAEGGSGAADSRSAIYSTTARSNVALRLIGRLKSNQATAGTWASAMTEVSNVPFALSSNVLSDAAATKLGQKTYYHGTTYNGGVAPTLSGTSWTTVRGWFRPYQDQAGTWFLQFQVTGQRAGGSISGFVVTINGILTPNITNFHQAIAAGANGGLSYFQGSIQPNDNSIIVNASVSQNYGSNYVCFYSTIELASKPTWAY